MGRVKKQGLYNPDNEHDACGIGFVANIKGTKSHEIVRRGLDVLINMTHRGAESADNVSGDGAGIMLQMPHEFFISKGIKLPAEGKYAAGLLFLPKNKENADKCLSQMENIIRNEGLDIIDYRDVPVNSSCLGEISLSTEPSVKQIFISAKNLEQDDIERKLFIIRKLTENSIRNSDIEQKDVFYIITLSTKIFNYKGMFTPKQLEEYFPDLTDPAMVSAISMVHSRFSTNTFPTWDLAQPFRYICHNGEINTIKGNRMWMHAREGILKTDIFGHDLQKLFPIIEPNKSDSASLDNAMEFLHLTGRSLQQSISMLIPESFNDKNPIPESVKAYYEYYSTIMEPWDGPASILFCDGRFVGGTLDRNGLRPSRYIITKDDMIAMGSEVGCQVFPAENIKVKGRLHPGKILLVDTQLGIIIPDSEIKSQLSRMNPYANWLKDNRLELDKIDNSESNSISLDNKIDEYKKVFGYSKEDIEHIVFPMCNEKYEPIGSMGNDVPIAVLSEKPQRLFQYFKQQFAQVTNPPIDPIREGLVMTLTNYIGSASKNILVDSPSHCKLIKFKSPIVTNNDFSKLVNLPKESFSNVVIPMLFSPTNNYGEALENALQKICNDAEKAVDDNISLIILSDRNIDADKCPIPSLLATSAVHNHLIRVKKRMQIGLIIESAEPREVHHFALLLGYGASVINPYGAYAVIEDSIRNSELKMDLNQAISNFNKAIDSGLLKIFSKMGISTLRSYHGAHIFEALGISQKVIDNYFTNTSTPISGIGLQEIAYEALINHQEFYKDGKNANQTHSGTYNFRKNGEFHAWNPDSIRLLQWSTRFNDYQKYKEFSNLINEQNSRPAFIRGFFDYKKNPIDINEVESIESILKRFCSGAMSYGSISKEAHEAIGIAMNRIGGRSNTGEGGESSERFKKLSNGDNARSAIKQIASGRFGVTINYLVNADELQIKIAQGAKPGEGGQLPGFKVNKNIAGLRHSTPGITLISPPPHHDIYSIEDLKQLIFDLKNSNPTARISVKLVSESGVGTIAAGVAKAFADLITISGYEGGTGASPLSSIKHAGIPMEIGLAEVQQTLVLNRLRSRIKIQTDGQLKNGKDVVLAGILGADEFGFATSALIVLGCVMMRKCHLNTCPVGVATQNEELRKRFLGKSEYLVNYFHFIAQEVREILAEMGYRSFDEIIGRTDLIEIKNFDWHWKAKTIDLSKLLYVPQVSYNQALHNTGEQNHQMGDLIDYELIKLSQSALNKKEKVWISKNINNKDRTVGTMLSSEIAKLFGDEGLPEDTISTNFYGSAGQSFGAFLHKGITFRLEGDSNDYVGKGLSGGKIIIVPPRISTFLPEENIIVGNTVLYGATEGELYIHGIAGGRFAVRNSGAITVVEGVGDHGCEYMTGGRVVILGKTGRNFAAGMSGGIAYVLDLDDELEFLCNRGLVEISKLDSYSDVSELQYYINNHYKYTNSNLAEKILVNWNDYVSKFKKIIPFEYKKVLEEQKLQQLKDKIAFTEDSPEKQY